MSDQSAKKDAGKPKLTLVPRQIIFDIAKVREYGNDKYGDPDNWKTVEIDRYKDAAYRHFMAYLDDPKGVDKESGIEHYKHLACNIAFICEMEKERQASPQTDKLYSNGEVVWEQDWDVVSKWQDYAKTKPPKEGVYEFTTNYEVDSIKENFAFSAYYIPEYSLVIDPYGFKYTPTYWRDKK